MKCPNCGAETQGNVCEYCGSELRRQKKTGACCSKCGSTNIAFKRENQGEIRGKNSKQIVHRTVGYCKDCGNTWFTSEDIPKKRKTWLWVLGWICVFPLPLTILLLRKKDMKPVIKFGLIAIAWIVYFLIVASGNSIKDRNAVADTTTSAAQVEETASTETPAPADTDPQVDTSEAATVYSEDAKVNQFITEYNEVTRYEMSDFSKGNIKSKMFGHSNDCYVEMLNPASTSGYSFIVIINGGNNEEITGKMIEVFPDFIHTFDSSISDEQIEQAISDFENEPSLRRDYKLGDDLTINYYPLVFRDDGTWLSSSRIEISSLTYGN